MKNDEEIKREIDEISYKVMRENGTERAGTSELNEEYRHLEYM